MRRSLAPRCSRSVRSFARQRLQGIGGNQANVVGLLSIDDELVVLDVVTERDGAAHPHALASRGRELVADALAASSRSNWANESRTLSVRRTIEIVVLNCW